MIDYDKNGDRRLCRVLIALAVIVFAIAGTSMATESDAVPESPVEDGTDIRLQYGIDFETSIDYRTIQIGEIVDVDINEPGDIAMFVFAPNCDGSYTFEFLDNRDAYGCLYDSEGQLIESCNEYNGYNYSMTKELSAGQQYILKVQLFNKSDVGSFSVLIHHTRYITAGGILDVNIDTPGKVEMIYFIPEEKGQYVIGVTGSPDAVVSYHEYNKELESDFACTTLYADSTFSFSIYLKDSSKTDSFKVYLKKLEYRDISVGDVLDVTIENAGDVDIFRFVSDGGDFFDFGSTGTKDTFGCRIYERSCITGGDGDNFLLKNMKYIGDRDGYNYLVAGMASSADTGSFKVFLKESECREISLGNVSEVVIDSPGDSELFCFVPETNGYYDFGSTGTKDTYGGFANYPYSNDAGEDKNFFVRQYLYSNSTYYLIAKLSSPSDTGSFNVYLKESEFIDISVGDVLKVNIDVARMTELFCFTADHAGFYEFGSIGSKNTFGTIFDYELYGNETEDGNFLIRTFLESGKHYLTACLNSFSDTGSFEVYLKELEYTDISVGDRLNVNIDTQGGYELFRFIPEEDMFYIFESIGEKDASVNLSSNKLNYYALGQNFHLERWLTSGNTYYLLVTLSSPFDTGSFEVRLSMSPYVNINDNDDLCLSIDEPGTFKILRFEAENDGTFIFDIDGEHNIRIDRHYSNSSYSYSYGSAEFVYSLTRHETITFRIGFDWYNDTGSITISLRSTVVGSTFNSEGIIYTITNSNNVKASVTGYEPGLKSAYIPYFVYYYGNEYSVTAIGDGAFSGCTSLKRVSVPNDIESIGDDAFSGLTFVDVDGSVIDPTLESLCGETFVGSDGVLVKDYVDKTFRYTYDGVTLNYKIVSNQPFAAALIGIDTWTSTATIPEEVVFNNHKATVKYIWDSALKYAPYTSVTLPSTITYIGNYAFRYSSVTSIVIPDSVESIGFGAFQNCTNLKEVTIDGSKIIWQRAFSGCDSLESVTFPGSLAYIDPLAFDGLSITDSLGTPIDVNAENLAGRYFKGSNGVLSQHLKAGTAFEADGLRYAANPEEDNTVALVGYSIPPSSLVVPENVAFDGVVVRVSAIGEGAFAECTSLESASMPSGVSSIGADAFYGCAALETVDMAEGVSEIGASAFGGCTSLKSVAIPSGVSHIEADAFQGCSFYDTDGSTELEISAGSLPGFAYEGSEGRLVRIFGASVGDTFGQSGLVYRIVSIEPYEVSVSGYTVAPTSLVVPSEVVYKTKAMAVVSVGKEAFFGCRSLTSIDLGDVRSIGVKAFANCSRIVSANIGENVDTISAYAFYKCAALKTIDIEDSAYAMRAFGSYSFYKCGSLEHIAIPSYVTTLGSNAFSVSFVDEYGEPLESNLESLKGYAYDRVGSVLERQAPVHIGSTATSEGVKYTVVTTLPAEAAVTGYDGGITSISLPETVSFDGYSVKVKCIDEGAFEGCTTLKTADLGPVSSIGSKAFYGCKALTSVSMTNVKSIGVKAFANCTKLASVDMGDSVKTVSAYGFYGCKALSEIEFSETVKTIGSNAFLKCSSLSHVTFGDSLKTLGSKAFSGTTFLDASGNVVSHTAKALRGNEYAGADRQLSLVVD